MISTLAMAATSMQGELHGEDREFAGVSTDTRSLRDGELFFALQGPAVLASRPLERLARRGGFAGCVAAHVVTIGRCCATSAPRKRIVPRS